MSTSCDQYELTHKHSTTSCYIIELGGIQLNIEYIRTNLVNDFDEFNCTRWNEETTTFNIQYDIELSDELDEQINDCWPIAEQTWQQETENGITINSTFFISKISLNVDFIDVKGEISLKEDDYWITRKKENLSLGLRLNTSYVMCWSVWKQAHKRL